MVRWLLCFPLIFSSPYIYAQDAKQLFDEFSNRIFQVRILEISSGNQAAIGSGFQIDTQGRVITNFHVVAEYVHYPQRYRIELENNHKEKLSIQLVNIDVVNDLAILKLENSQRTEIELADSLPANGEPIYSLGNPHDLGLTVVPGTFNGITSHSLYERIHISGAINSGMSGGPTLNSVGKVVGVNVASSGNQVGFLVPLHRLRSFIDKSTTAQLDPGQFQQAIRDQLYTNQEIVMNELLQLDWKMSTLGKASVPAEVAAYLRCWGDNKSKPDLNYDYLASYCLKNENIYISNSFETGTILFQFGWYESDQLNRFQFYNMLKSEGASMSAENIADKENVTSFKCHDDLVKAGSKGERQIITRVAYCAREYKKYPGLYDVMYLGMTAHEDQQALLSHFSMLGVSSELAAKFSKKFIESIVWN